MKVLNGASCTPPRQTECGTAQINKFQSLLNEKIASQNAPEVGGKTCNNNSQRSNTSHSCMQNFLNSPVKENKHCGNNNNNNNNNNNYQSEPTVAMETEGQHTGYPKADNYTKSHYGNLFGNGPPTDRQIQQRIDEGYFTMETDGSLKFNENHNQKTIARLDTPPAENIARDTEGLHAGYPSGTAYTKSHYGNLFGEGAPTDRQVQQRIDEGYFTTKPDGSLMFNENHNRAKIPGFPPSPASDVALENQGSHAGYPKANDSTKSHYGNLFGNGAPTESQVQQRIDEGYFRVNQDGSLRFNENHNRTEIPGFNTPPASNVDRVAPSHHAGYPRADESTRSHYGNLFGNTPPTDSQVQQRIDEGYFTVNQDGTLAFNENHGRPIIPPLIH